MSPAVAGSMAAAAAVVAALAGMVQLGRWRTTAEAPAPWLAAGLFVYSAAGLAVPGVAVLVSPAIAASDSGPTLLRPVAVPIVVALFVAAVCSSEGRNHRLLWWPLVVGLVATVGVAWSPAMRSVLGPSLASAPPPGLASAGQLAVVAAWWGLAAAFARRARRSGDVGWWVPLMLAALGASRLCLAISGGASSWAIVGSQVFRGAAVVAALGGALLGMQALIVALRHELRSLQVELGRERSHLHAVEVEDGSRRHQLHNGLAAIGGTAWLLEHHSRAIDEGMRTQLVEGVTGEVRRLQRLLESPVHEGER